jgi:hypothetical protein
MAALYDAIGVDYRRFRQPDPRIAVPIHDLASGAWHRRYAELLVRDELDLGYRLVVTHH